MENKLEKIINNYLDSDRDNDSLIEVLEGLDAAQLMIVIGHIEKIEEKHGECNLHKLIENPSDLSVITDHPEDSGATYDRSTYRVSINVATKR